METLLLTAGYEPVGLVGWQRAVVLWWLDKAEIVAPYQDREIRGADWVMPMPCVVRLLRSGPRRGSRGLKPSRRNVYRRDTGRCQYCADRLAFDESTLDHVVPRRLGGRSTWENLVLACRPCNQRKGGRTPDEAHMPLPRPPRRPHGLGGPETWIDQDSLPSAWRPYLGPAASAER